MITLSPGSLCDVCAEEYGPHNYPHCIPCGECHRLIVLMHTHNDRLPLQAMYCAEVVAILYFQKLHQKHLPPVLSVANILLATPFV